MPSIYWIISIVVLSGCFAGIFLIAKFTTKSVDDEKFSFMRMFPFEIIKNSEKGQRFYLILTYVFAAMCFSPIILLFEDYSSFENLNRMSILICAILCLSGISFVFLHIFEVSHVKPHLILFTTFTFLTLLSGALILSRSLVAYFACVNHGRSEPLLLIVIVVSILSLLLNLLIILNPKLLNWAKLDKMDGQDVGFKRPLKFPLAYSEWAIFIILFINELIFFIGLLIK